MERVDSSPRDEATVEWRRIWGLRTDTTYLNHGSFGPAPKPVREARALWQWELDRQPMDFFVRRHEPAWRDARAKLAQWLGAAEDDLVFVENATYGMNVIAHSFPLQAGDEVLLTDHEYGAVTRIWERACRRADAAPPKTARLPQPLEDAGQVTDALFSAVTERTRLLVVSHITSPTAVILPVSEIVRRAAAAGIPVCIDGPHALAQISLDLASLGCDFYTASCHKWLSAPFGSGFLYVAPRWQPRIEPPLLSWGRLSPAQPAQWSDEFIWSGTRDPSPYLAVPAAIQFLAAVGWHEFRHRTHALAQYARHQLVELTKLEPLVPDSPDWYGSMAHVPLPAGDRQLLQDALWQRYQIEVPVVTWDERRWIRVSCHLYNEASQIDRLVDALHRLLNEGL